MRDGSTCIDASSFLWASQCSLFRFNIKRVTLCLWCPVFFRYTKLHHLYLIFLSSVYPIYVYINSISTPISHQFKPTLYVSTSHNPTTYETNIFQTSKFKFEHNIANISLYFSNNLSNLVYCFGGGKSRLQPSAACLCTWQGWSKENNRHPTRPLSRRRTDRSPLRWKEKWSLVVGPRRRKQP